MEAFLEVDSILKSFGQRRVLTDISLSCHTVDIIGLLGRNGSGKSTFLKILFGTLHADNQFIRIDSAICPKPYLVKGLVKYLPQHSFLPRNLTVRKAIDLFIPDKSDILLGDPLISKVVDNKIGVLSGGEGRYLEIRLILESGAKFILLDEPFNGISPLMVHGVKELIAARSADAGIILTDHDYRNVLDVARRFILLYDGGMKVIRDPEELVKWGYLPGS
jgi:lipopolysaccharide export system ATP-binding protein